jgi:hypothetical protein
MKRTEVLIMCDWTRRSFAASLMALASNLSDGCPAEAQFTIQFVAAVCTNSTAGQSALALIGYLSSPEAMPQTNRQGQQGQACCQEQEEVRS